MSHEGQAQRASAGALIRQESENNTRLAHKGPQQRRVESAFKKQAARAFAQRLEHAIERRLAQTAVSGGALKSRGELTEPGIKLEIPEMPDCGEDTAGRLAGRRRNNVWRSDKLDVEPQLLDRHGGGFDSTGKVFADAPEVFAG